MGAHNHPTTVPDNMGQDNDWSVTLEADGTTFHKAFTVPGPKRVQALNQAWNRVPGFLENRSIDVPERTVDLTLKEQ